MQVIPTMYLYELLASTVMVEIGNYDLVNSNITSKPTRAAIIKRLESWYCFCQQVWSKDYRHTVLNLFYNQNLWLTLETVH